MEANVTKSRTRFTFFLINASLILILLLYGIVWWRLAERISSGRVDLINCYTAGKILIAGKGKELYDLKLQAQVQQALLKNYVFEGGVLAYVRPPFQSLIYLPFSYLSFLPAYWAWSVCMVLVGVLSVLLLLRLPDLKALRPWSIQIYLATFCFFPVFISLVQGQDSLMLLFFMTWAFTLLKKGKQTQAGFILALGLFKFHLLLPLYFVLLLKKKWKVIQGSIYSGLLLVVLSYLAVGTQGMIGYVRLLHEMVNWTHQYNFNPSQMRNLRGMLTLIWGEQSQSIQVASAILTGICLFLLLWSWRKPSTETDERFDLQYSLSLIVGLLASHYLFVHDESVLILPLVVLLDLAQAQNSYLRRWTIFLILAASPAMVLPVLVLAGYPIPINVLYLIILFGTSLFLSIRETGQEKIALSFVPEP